MLTAVVLICSLNVTPDLADCNAGNAVHVFADTQEQQTPNHCLRRGLELAASTSIAQHPDPDERVIIRCERLRSARS